MHVAAARGDRCLVVVGSGGRPYREYAFDALARHHRVSLVLGAEATWQRPFVEDAAVADVTDPAAVAAAVRSLARGREVGVLTWDETVLEVTAQAAERLGLPHMSAAAAAACRDKHEARTRLAARGMGVRHVLARTAGDAVRAAEAIGYPVVVKPRALAASLGVALVEDGDAVRAAFDLATTSSYATLTCGDGVLVEEVLDGPEVSVDCVVHGGAVTCVHVARKRVGFAPCFEEVGHLVTGWSHEPWAGAVRDLVARAHAALGVDHGVTHAEVKLTSRGPRLVELNGRLGGDLIPFVSRVATGVDLVLAAADLAFDRRPSLPEPGTAGAAEVRFVYPPWDCVVRSVDVAPATAVPGVVHAVALADPGAVLRLPPVDPIPRLAAVVVAGADEAACRVALDRAEAAVAADVEPLVAATAS